MNVENNRKPFPFLRKGDGLTRYSSLTIPRYRQLNLRCGSNREDCVPMSEGNGDSVGQDKEAAGSAKPSDSGKGSSPDELEVETNHDRCNIESTPNENDDALEPSLTERRLAWEAKEQRDKLEASQFEALERFLALMNSTLKSDCSALYKSGALNISPTRQQSNEPAEAMTVAATDQNTRNVHAMGDKPAEFLHSPPPAAFTRGTNGFTQHPVVQPTALSHVAPWTFSHPGILVPPRFAPSNLQHPLLGLNNIGKNNPVAEVGASAGIEKELRALMTNLERDVEELQRRRVVFDEHVERTKKQLCAEWQSVEQEKEVLKIQRMKIEQDKNDLLTHRVKMEEEIELNLGKCNKANEELKMLQTECQLLKRKLQEQKKQSSDEISSVQQQVIDLQRQAVEADSRVSSFRAQITKLKDECRQHKEEADSCKGRIKLLETANERLRIENAQRRDQFVERREKAANCVKTPTFSGDQGKTSLVQTPKCVRFADEPTTFRRTRDFCVQATGPSDIATQTSFVDSSPAAGDNWPSPEDDTVLQRTLRNGKQETIYPNDVVRIRGSDGVETFNYPNGDVLRCLPDGGKIYHCASDGRTEILNVDGTLIVKNADGTSEKYTFLPDGTENITYSNGTRIEKRPYGVEIAYLDDKSKETRCSHYTLREFPTGDIKKLFVDGSTETRLTCGRVRVKDAQGNVVKDIDEYSSWSVS